MTATISPAYLDEQVLLHRCGYYGAYSDKWAPFVADLVRTIGARSVLDYGCGQGRLLVELAALLSSEVSVQGYDPAVTAFTAEPDPADLVVCTDVLEHVEPAHLKAVCGHLARLTRHALFTVIATRPATKWLSDGRNAHLIVKPASWWYLQLESHGWRAVTCPVPMTVADTTLEYWDVFTRKAAS